MAHAAIGGELLLEAFHLLIENEATLPQDAPDGCVDLSTQAAVLEPEVQERNVRHQ